MKATMAASFTSVSHHSISGKLGFSVFSFVVTLATLVMFGTDYCQAESKFMGAGSCSTSNCHGSSAPRKGSPVMLNEFVTWQKHDFHSKAWKVLTEADGQRIGKNLGLAHPENEKLCLDCHATEANLKDEKFSVQDGVSCESCHGAAEGWLSSHASSKSSHKDNVANGMFDLVDLEKRAKLCISCHIGNENKRVSHRLIGAGHPRLSFELDTFSILQPRHWDEDDDYKERKLDYNAVQAWLIGQAVVALDALDAMESPRRSKDGMWPELTLFNCYACHHSLTEDQWKKREYKSKPGELQLNVSSLLMVKAASETISPKAASAISEGVTALHQAYKSGNAGAVISKLRSAIKGNALPAFRSANLTEAQLRKVLKSVVHYAASVPVYQYEEAEQIAMGMSAVLAANRNISLDHRASVDAIYDTLADPEAFVAEKFGAEAGRFSKRL
jgi:hypothetical protein